MQPGGIEREGDRLADPDRTGVHKAGDEPIAALILIALLQGAGGGLSLVASK